MAVRADVPAKIHQGPKASWRTPPTGCRCFFGKSARAGFGAGYPSFGQSRRRVVTRVGYGTGLSGGSLPGPLGAMRYASPIVTPRRDRSSPMEVEQPIRTGKSDAGLLQQMYLFPNAIAFPGALAHKVLCHRSWSQLQATRVSAMET